MCTLPAKGCLTQARVRRASVLAVFRSDPSREFSLTEVHEVLRRTMTRAEVARQIRTLRTRGLLTTTHRWSSIIEQTWKATEGGITLPEVSMGEIAKMDDTGDTKIIWSKDNDDEVAVARRAFKDLKDKGFIAYSVKGKNGEKNEVIREFDPDSEKIIMAPPMVGG